MAKKFYGDYKNIPDDQLPVFTFSVTVMDLRTNKMASITSVHSVQVGARPSYADLKRDAQAQARDAVANLIEQSEKWYVAPKALLTEGTVAP